MSSDLTKGTKGAEWVPMTSENDYFAKHLSPKWRFLIDEYKETYLFLHPSGLWFEIAQEFYPSIGERTVEAMEEALAQAIKDGVTGMVMLEIESRFTGLDRVDPGPICRVLKL